MDQSLDPFTIVAQAVDFNLVNAEIVYPGGSSSSSSSSVGSTKTSSLVPTSTGSGPLPPSNSVTAAPYSGRSTGVKIGIGVAVPLGVIVIAIIVGAYLVRRKRQERVEGLHGKPQLEATEIPGHKIETKANIGELAAHETPGELFSPKSRWNWPDMMDDNPSSPQH